MSEDLRKLINRPFLSCPLSPCQNESTCESIHMKSVLSVSSFSCKSNSISYERFCTKTRFETEARGNLEMTYWLSIILIYHQTVRSYAGRACLQIKNCCSGHDSDVRGFNALSCFQVSCHQIGGVTLYQKA